MLDERPRGLLPALGLAILAPLVGEYLLGNISIRELPALPFLVPMYGCGALLIREVVRRTGHGWATILVLGAAYGVLEPGVFDGSLFNPSFEGMDFTAGYIPALGFSPYYLLHIAVGHAVWSITIPIVLVEALTPGRRKTPWLGTVGLAVIALGYVLGGLLIQRAMRDSGDFHTSAAQATGTVLGAAVLVLIAFRVGRRSAGPATKPAPRPLMVGIGAFVMSSVFFAMTEGWPGFVASLLLLPVAAAVVARLSRRPGWQDRHRLALASGASFTYAWGGFVLTWLKYRMDPVSLVGNAVFALGAVVLVVVAWRRSTRERLPKRDVDQDAAERPERARDADQRTGQPPRLVIADVIADVIARARRLGPDDRRDHLVRRAVPDTTEHEQRDEPDHEQR